MQPPLVKSLLRFLVRYMFKGTEAAGPIEHVWEALAAILITLAIIKMARHWQLDIEKHSQLIGDNIAFISQTDYLMSLVKAGQLKPESVDVFILNCSALDRADANSLGRPTPEEFKTANLQALKEIEPMSAITVCPTCGANPWDFIPGSCSQCGNKPQKERNEK